jgi:hypothetical protein
MVVTNVIIHQAFQMPFVENEHRVEQIATAVSNPRLGDAVLPGAAKDAPLRLDAEALHAIDRLCIEAVAAIKDQVATRRVIRERLVQLLDDLGAGWMPGRVILKNASPVV